MANLNDLNFKSILTMNHDEALELLHKIRSRQITKAYPKKKKITKTKSLVKKKSSKENNLTIWRLSND